MDQTFRVRIQDVHEHADKSGWFVRLEMKDKSKPKLPPKYYEVGRYPEEKQYQDLAGVWFARYGRGLSTHKPKLKTGYNEVFTLMHKKIAQG